MHSIKKWWMLSLKILFKSDDSTSRMKLFCFCKSGEELWERIVNIAYRNQCVVYVSMWQFLSVNWIFWFGGWRFNALLLLASRSSGWQVAAKCFLGQSRGMCPPLRYSHQKKLAEQEMFVTYSTRLMRFGMLFAGR